MHDILLLEDPNQKAGFAVLQVLRVLGAADRMMRVGTQRVKNSTSRRHRAAGNLSYSAVRAGIFVQEDPLMFRSFAILRHFAISLRTSALNASGVMPVTPRAPSAANRALMSSAAMML